MRRVIFESDLDAVGLVVGMVIMFLGGVAIVAGVVCLVWWLA